MARCLMILWAGWLVGLALGGCAAPTDATAVATPAATPTVPAAAAATPAAPAPGLEVLTFHTHQVPSWIRYRNVDASGARQLTGASYPFVHVATGPGGPLAAAPDAATLAAVRAQYGAGSADRIDGWCDTTTLAGISPDLFCRPGTAAWPVGWGYLVLYAAAGGPAVAVTTAFAWHPPAVAGPVPPARGSDAAPGSAAAPAPEQGTGATPAGSGGASARSSAGQGPEAPVAAGAGAAPAAGGEASAPAAAQAGAATGAPDVAVATAPEAGSAPLPVAQQQTADPPPATPTPKPPATATPRPRPKAPATNTPVVGDTPAESGRIEDVPREPEEECTSPIGCDGGYDNE